jgi:glutathione S-transferase
MAEATLLISSKNYSSWSLRGYLLAKLSGIDFAEDC